MPFPTIDYPRYVRLALGIGLGLVTTLFIYARHFILTILIYSTITLDFDHLGTSSPLSLEPLLLSDTLASGIKF